MATEIAKAYVQLIPSARGIKGKIENAIGGEANSAGTTIGKLMGGNLVSTLGNVVAAAGIGKALQSSILEGANLQQSLGGVETLFKGSADRVIENAKKAYLTAGLSANEYMETVTGFSASLLQSLGGDTEKAAKIADMALIDMSDNANKFGTSMESIKYAYQGFAKQNYTMLDNLKLGYGGTKAEMERLLADAQKISGVKYDISNLSDVYNAIHVIQDQLGVTGTTSKEAAQTFTGSFNAMKAAAANLLGSLSLGEGVGPAVEALISTMGTFLFNNFIPMIGNIIKSLPTVIITAFKALVPVFVDLGGQVMSFFNSGFTSKMNDVYTQFSGLIQSTLNYITASLPEFLNVGVELINSIVNGLLDSIPGLLDIAGDLIISFVRFFIQNTPIILQAGANIILNLINGIIRNLPKVAESAIKFVNKYIQVFVSEGPKFYQQGVSVIVNFVKGLASKLPEFVSTVITVVGNFMGQLIQTIIANFPQILDAGRQILKTLIIGLLEMVVELFSAMEQVASIIWDNLKNIDLLQVGKMILTTLFNGFKLIWKTIQGLFSDVAPHIKSTLSKIDLLAIGRKILQTLFDGIKAVWESIKSWLGNIGSHIKNAVSNIDLSGAGRAIMNGFSNGLKGAWGGVKRFVGGIASWISRNKGPIEYDRSLLVPHGQAMMFGLQEGLEKSFNHVKKTVSGMANTVQNIVQESLSDVDSFELMGSITLKSLRNEDIEALLDERAQLERAITTVQHVQVKDNGEKVEKLERMLLSVIELLERLLGKDTNAYLDRVKVSRAIDDPLRRHRRNKDLNDRRTRGDW